MKTTIDLPEELVREMKLKAAREGGKLKDVVTTPAIQTCYGSERISNAMA